MLTALLALFSIKLSTGIYNFTASFAGDSTYESSSDDVNSVDVSVDSTTLSVPDFTATVNETFISSATLKGKSSGVGVADKNINFTYNGVSLGDYAVFCPTRPGLINWMFRSRETTLFIQVLLPPP